jgi:hypothetical protein
MRVGGKAFRSIWLGDDGVCVEIDQTLLPHEPAEILGDAGSVVTFIMTVTIIPFMPSGWAESAGGFPAMTLDDKVANHSTLPEAVGTRQLRRFSPSGAVLNSSSTSTPSWRITTKPPVHSS